MNKKNLLLLLRYQTKKQFLRNVYVIPNPYDVNHGAFMSSGLEWEYIKSANLSLCGQNRIKKKLVELGRTILWLRYRTTLFFSKERSYCLRSIIFGSIRDCTIAHQKKLSIFLHVIKMQCTFLQLFYCSICCCKIRWILLIYLKLKEMTGNVIWTKSRFEVDQDWSI